METPRGTLDAKVANEGFSQEIQKVGNAVNRIADRNNALQNDLQNNVGSLENEVRRSNVQERNAFKRLGEEQRALALTTLLVTAVKDKVNDGTIPLFQKTGGVNPKITSQVLNGLTIAFLLFYQKDIYSSRSNSLDISKIMSNPLIIIGSLLAIDLVPWQNILR